MSKPWPTQQKLSRPAREWAGYRGIPVAEVQGPLTMWWPDLRYGWRQAWGQLLMSLRGWPMGQRYWGHSTGTFVEPLYLPLPWCWINGTLLRYQRVKLPWCTVVVAQDRDALLAAWWGLHWIFRGVRAAWRWWLRISWRCWFDVPGTRPRP